MKPTRYYSSKQEQYIAELLGGTQCPNSGATGFKKGDVVTNEWLIECKTTTKPKTSFSIKKEWIDKNNIERVEMLKPYSAIAFQFEECGTNYFVIDEKTFKYLWEETKHD